MGSAGCVGIGCAGVFSVGLSCVSVSDMIVSSEVIGTVFCYLLEIVLIDDVFEDGDNGLESRCGVVEGDTAVVIVSSVVLETFSRILNETYSNNAFSAEILENANSRIIHDCNIF